MINGYSIYSIIVTALVCILGFFVSYIRTKTSLVQKAGDFINKAEEDYKSVTKAGAQKFDWVVISLYSLVPAPMKLFITQQMISEIVQKVFDQAEAYATKQLDKVVDKIIE